jgi:hypothetical protein
MYFKTVLGLALNRNCVCWYYLLWILKYTVMSVYSLYAVLESSWRTLCSCVFIVSKELKGYIIWWEILEQVNSKRLHLLLSDFWFLLICMYVCRCKIMVGNIDLASLNINTLVANKEILWNVKSHARKLLAATF